MADKSSREIARSVSNCGGVLSGSSTRPDESTCSGSLSTSSWHNARDPEDVVALFPLDAVNFSTNPAIDNYNDVDNETDNQHGIIGYLPDQRVAKSIHEALVSA